MDFQAGRARSGQRRGMPEEGGFARKPEAKKTNFVFWGRKKRRQKKRQAKNSNQKKTNTRI
jgi:hypothetical protein